MAKETKQFQAEVKQILDLMIHSLYSQKEIFLRELISNSSDALDKLRFHALSQPDWKVDSSQLEIRLTPNKEARTLKVEDNGYGMNFEEVEQNIGTIAHSGTGQFLKNLKEVGDKPELIGQFGVGFYSAFMVAEKVILHTQRPDSNEGVLWESTGDGTYSIDKVPRPGGHGTSITLHLKKDLEEDFTKEWVLKGIVKKYSDFISFPIKMETSREETDRDKDGKIIEGTKKTVVTDETLNSQTAIWLKNPTDVKSEEYNEFYKHISHDWSDPLKHIHFKAEGTQEFSSLMYVPSQPPMDFNVRDAGWGLQLYVKRVFIMDHCEDLLPPYLRFIKGVVDSSDLSLNVSREILQQDHQIQAIKKALTNKILSQLKTWQKSSREEYERLWAAFGATLKEGVHIDHTNKEKLVDLLLFRSSHSGSLTSLAEYVERIKPDQKSIFFMTGDKLDEIKDSPLLDKFAQKGLEVLLLTDAIDEWVTTAIANFKDLEFQSVLDEGVDIDTPEEKKDLEESKKEAEKAFGSIISTFKEQLKDEIKDVRVSTRLTSAPVCLVSSSSDPSVRMERIMGALGKDLPKAKRILEINSEHPILKKMLELSEEKKSNWAKVLYSQALLQEGTPLKNPVDFSKELSKMMELF